MGEEEEHYANVRVICTTQQPLQHYVEQGKMRSDLFHRLNVLTLNLPRLRERVKILSRWRVNLSEKSVKNSPFLYRTLMLNFYIIYNNTLGFLNERQSVAH